MLKYDYIRGNYVIWGLLGMFLGGSVMFAIGDKVVYPMHGAGVVEAIEERIFDSRPTKYLVLSMFLGNMKVHVPLESVDKIGLRTVSDAKAVKKIEGVLKERTANNMRSITWNRRFAIYVDKMKSGNVLDLAEVIRILAVQDHEKKLSTGERRLLASARQILASELMITANSDLASAEAWIDKFLK